jgi:hypothetical protein
MWTDSFRSRYVRSLEQQIVELKAEKQELKGEVQRLNQLLVPGLRAMEREHKAQVAQPAAVVPLNKQVAKLSSTDDPNKGRVERLPPVTGWIQARDRAEHLSQEQ